MSEPNCFQDYIRPDIPMFIKPWGYEEWIIVTPDYVLKKLFIKKGERLSLQYHEVKDETMVLAQGKIWLTIGKFVRRNGILAPRIFEGEFRVNQAVHVKPNTVHRLSALEDSIVYEASTPQLDDIVRLSDDYGRTAQ